MSVWRTRDISYVVKLILCWHNVTFTFYVDMKLETEHDVLE